MHPSRMKLLTFFSILLVAFLPACPKEAENPTVTVSDAGTDSDAEPPDGPAGTYKVPDCQKACIKLGEIGCPEAIRKAGEDSCYVVCKRAQESGKFDFKPACIAKARDKSSVLACGTYRCK